MVEQSCPAKGVRSSRPNERQWLKKVETGGQQHSFQSTGLKGKDMEEGEESHEGLQGRLLEVAIAEH